jgi:hypothetical protein
LHPCTETGIALPARLSCNKEDSRPTTPAGHLSKVETWRSPEPALTPRRLPER